MMKYERFTKKIKGVCKTYNGIDLGDVYNEMLDSGERFFTGKAIDRLAELEDKIESGLMIELPDTAHKFAVVEYSWQKKKPLKVVEYYPCSYDFQSKRIVNCYLSDNMNFYIVEKDFSTREEAEKRLSKLQGDKE